MPFLHIYLVKVEKASLRILALKDALAFYVANYTPSKIICQPLFAIFLEENFKNILFFEKCLDILQDGVYNAVI